MVKPEGGQKGDERHTYMVLTSFGGDVLSEQLFIANLITPIIDEISPSGITYLTHVVPRAHCIVSKPNMMK